jgi:hypothetical protein
MLRPFLLACALWFTTAIAHADFGPLPLLGAGGGGQSSFLPPCLPTGNSSPCSPNGGIFLGYDNTAQGGVFNNYINLLAGATYIPPTPNPWVFVVKFRADDQNGQLASGTSPFTILSFCSSIGCGGGNDRLLQYTNIATSTGYQLLFSGKTASTTNLWGGTSGATGITLSPATFYTVVIAQYTDGGMSISAVDSNGNQASGSPSLQAGPNNSCSNSASNYYCNAGTTRTSAQMGNLFNLIGSAYTTTTVQNNGSAGPFADAAMLTGTLPNTSDVPTASVVQALANGSQTVGQWATANGLTITSHYSLSNGSLAADPSGTFTTAATTTGTDINAIVAASPLTPPSCLTLTEQGPYDVERVDPGQTSNFTGTFQFRGTVNSTTCGFTPEVDGQVLDHTGTAVSSWTPLTVTGSTYAGSISGIPASVGSTNYYTLQVRLHNSPNYSYVGTDRHYIGTVLLLWGQSQQVFCTAPGTAGAGTGSQLAGPAPIFAASSPGMPFVNTVLQLSDTGTNPSNYGFRHPSLVTLDSYNNPGSASTIQIAGDCETELAADLSAITSWPVKIVSIAKSGQATDAWAFDYSPQIATMSGTGTGTYTSTSIFASASPAIAGTGANFVGSLSGVNTTGNIQMSALKGSVSLVDSTGTTVATETGGGTFIGTNIAAGGTLNYLTGAISGVTFTTSQNSPLTAKWTMIQDTNHGSYLQQNPYIGYPTFGDSVNSSSGYATAVLNRMSGPPSAIEAEQCTTNAPEVAAAIPPTANTSGGNLSLQTKQNYLFGTKLAAFWWSNSNTPILIAGYPRDAGKGAYTIQGCQQYLHNLGTWTGTGPTLGQYTFIGDYQDDLVQCTAVTLCLSPHEGPWPAGGRRFGRRLAPNIACALYSIGCTTVSEPTITSASRSGTTITLTFNLPNGGALTTCGSTFAGVTGNNPPSTTANTCSPPTTPIGTPVTDFQFGLISTELFNQDGLQTGIGNGTFDDTKKFTCVIASANTVTCTGSWFTSGMYWNYGQTGLYEAGMVRSITASGGTGYTNGATATLSGGTCTTHGTGTIAATGGIITGITRLAPGANCTVADNAITGGGGAGATISTTLWTTSDDFNSVGQILYDNSGGCGGTQSSTVYEPGCPVAPIAIPQSVPN